MSTHFTVQFYDEHDEWVDGDGDYDKANAAIARADEYLRQNLTHSARIIQCREVLDVSITKPFLKIEKVKRT